MSYMKWTIDPIREADHLERSMRNKIIRIAMNKASSTVKNSVIAYAPVRYGFLKKSIKIKIKQYRAKGVWVAIVGPQSKFKKQKGKTKDGNPILHQPSRYAMLLEKGTKHARANPFLKPAFDSTKQQFQSILTQSIKQQIDIQMKKA